MTKILIVDDQPNNLNVLTEMLAQQTDYALYTAVNGEMALRNVGRVQPDIILLDIMMPGVDGFAVCRRLKADPTTADIPILFLSSKTDVQDKVRGFELGAVDYVTKPFQAGEVLARLRTHLDLRRLQRNLEAQVAAQTARLRELDARKSEFLAVLSHELRTPLTVIKGYLGILAGKAAIKDDATLARMVGLANQGTDRASEMVNVMLLVSKLEQQIALHPSPVHLHLLLDTLAFALQKALAERHISLHYDLKSLPAIQADHDYILALFEHVIGNAIKYTPDGGHITVSGAETALDGGRPGVTIQVADTGIGLDPAYHELVFEKFFRLGEVALHSSSKTKFKGGGPGLGLALAKAIVEAHGGRIGLTSPGCDEASYPGVTVHFTLPPLLQENE